MDVDEFYKSYIFSCCSIDATEEPTSALILGRLINHGEKSEINAKMRLIPVDHIPALCLFALRDIQLGEEILYDYGIKDLPWKKKIIVSPVLTCDGNLRQGFNSELLQSSRLGLGCVWHVCVSLSVWMFFSNYADDRRPKNPPSIVINLSVL